MGIFSMDEYIYFKKDIEKIIKNSKDMTKEEIVEALKKAIKDLEEA